MISKQLSPQDLWKAYAIIQKQLLDAKIDECVDLVIQLHNLCTEILEKSPNDLIAIEMETYVIPQIVGEMCDINYDRMKYIFGEPK